MHGSKCDERFMGKLEHMYLNTCMKVNQYLSSVSM